ncbi:hypothetical protein LK537_12470 [Lachnoclostridium pacaense]|uniref:hypothetical protein n=1 Tax=Enterocloster hominis (ex Hitch et al. 2024) TaxID=1917870 RepID=UPI001D1002FB|nr:hypothetical protein [Lachnoclostridium pacaense]MCC2818110.1 hypothetical protein [Lachnoclostridium pacaense]
MGFITYSDDEKKIVESGVTAIGDVLEGNDVNAKERLLLCLDYYLDPYYKNTLPYGKEITGLLEHVIISNNPLSLKEDALNLLTSYGYPPFPILEQNLSCIEDQLMPDVMYALNMGRSDGLLYALLDKCCRIFRELAGYARGQDASYYGEMPQSAIIQYCQNQTTEIAGYLKNSPCCTWRLDHLPDDSPRTGEEGGPLPVVVVGNDVRHRISPVSGMYYPEAGFWISFHLDKTEAYLIYQMGPRFGRCFTYDVCFHDGYRAELTNEQVIWVS